jgi:pSer/pThr/pTyr-binding forkhead associated (FHA) protein
MARITINRDTFKVDERELEQGTLTIGRSQDNGLHIDDPTVSGHHAQIVTVFDSSYVEDLGSTNGTFVNGKKTRTHTLHNGDLLTIGQYQLLFQTDNSAAMQNANATMMMGVSQLEELTKKAKQIKFANAPVAPASPPGETAPKLDGHATQKLPPHLIPTAGKPTLKVHKNTGEPATSTTDELPDIDDSTNLIDRQGQPTPAATMRPLRKSDTSPLPSLKVIALAALAAVATFTLLMLFFF